MKELVIRGVASEEELGRAHELMGKAFADDYYYTQQWLSTVGTGYPGYHREHTRVALCGEEIAAALRLTTDTIRIGEARLKMGGIGWVATAQPYRRKGFMAHLMQDAFQYMRRHNYHVSMLFGIPNFYHQFGYVSALAEFATSVPVSEGEAVQHTPYKLRNAKPGDIAAIQKIHAAQDGHTACSLIRSVAHMRNGWRDWKGVRVLTNASGKVTGYFLAKPDKDIFQFHEACAVDWANCGNILHACIRLSEKACLPRLRFLGPPSHPMIQRLMHFHSTHEMRLERNANGMMALVNLPESLESMLPEWEHRLRSSAMTTESVEITLIVDRKPYRIRSHHGALDIAAQPGKNKFSLSGGELLQLMTGYHHLEEVLARKRRMLTQPARNLLPLLFPKRTPFVWPRDRF